MKCERKFFGSLTTYISCPEPSDPPSYKYCCGSSWDRYTPPPTTTNTTPEKKD
jgi:hypothetical protein